MLVTNPAGRAAPQKPRILEQKCRTLAMRQSPQRKRLTFAQIWFKDPWGAPKDDNGLGRGRFHLSGFKRLTLSLPLFGILTMLAASTVAAQPRPPSPVSRETSGQAQTPAPSGSRGENFSANKTPAQLFQSDCTGAGCHKTAGGLAKNSSSMGLAGFLREHYTNSRESAAALAAYLLGAGPGPAERPGRGEPATPRPPRAATRTPAAGEEAKPEEGQGPLTPARPRRQQATPGPASAPTGETPTPPGDIVRPEPGAKPAPAAAQQRNQRGRQQPQHTTAAPAPAPEAAAPPPPPPPPPPVVHDIFD